LCFLWGRAIRKNASIIGVYEIERKFRKQEEVWKRNWENLWKKKKKDIVVREEKRENLYTIVQFRLLAKSLFFESR
jgi:hypothetical protein